MLTSKHLSRIAFVMLGGFASFVITEVLLRLLPIQSSMGNQPMARFPAITGGEPGNQFVYTRDWNFTLFNRGEVNSDGFHAAGEFPPSGADDVTIVVGDSFIESVMVPADQTLQARLGMDLHGSAKSVPGLGISGAELGAMHYFIERANTIWQVDNVVLVVGSNDIKNANFSRGMPYYSPDGNLVSQEAKSKIRSTYIKDVVKKSALANFVVGQLRLWPKKMVDNFREAEMQNFPFYDSLQILPETANIDFSTFFSFLDQELLSKGKKIVVVINDVLPNPSEDVVLRRDPVLVEFLSLCKDRDISLVETGEMVAEMKEQGLRARWMRDGHWTPEMHEKVASEVAHYIK